jgi:hypothetical protein
VPHAARLRDRRAQEPGVLLELRDDLSQQVDGLVIVMSRGEATRVTDAAEITLEAVGERLDVVEVSRGLGRYVMPPIGRP